MAGVAVSTVCDVLKGRQGKVKVSQETKKKIFDAVKKLDYQPQASARALSTGKTHNIGFLLSAKTPLGLTNYYFSSILAGVEHECKKLGYNLIVGTHDLSTAKNFVAPNKLKSRSVDGMIVCGSVENEVVKLLVKYGIPFILVGETAEYPREEVLSVAEDMVSTWYDIFAYFFELGHRNIFVGGVGSPRVSILMQESVNRFLQDQNDKDLNISIDDVFADPDQIGYAIRLGQNWKTLPEKYTATVGHGHWCIGFARGLLESGCKCPDDVSIISTTDDIICKYFIPSISTYASPVFENATKITHLLVDYIDNKIGLDEAKKNAESIWQKTGLIIRESTSRPKSL